MEQEKVIVVLNLIHQKRQLDIEIPLDISVYELVTALKETFQLPIKAESMYDCHIRTENPIGFFRGNQILAECRIMNGTIINV